MNLQWYDSSNPPIVSAQLLLLYDSEVCNVKMGKVIISGRYNGSFYIDHNGRRVDGITHYMYSLHLLTLMEGGQNEQQ